MLKGAGFLPRCSNMGHTEAGREGGREGGGEMIPGQNPALCWMASLLIDCSSLNSNASPGFAIWTGLARPDP